VKRYDQRIDILALLFGRSPRSVLCGCDGADRQAEKLDLAAVALAARLRAAGSRTPPTPGATGRACSPSNSGAGIAPMNDLIGMAERELREGLCAHRTHRLHRGARRLRAGGAAHRARL